MPDRAARLVVSLSLLLAPALSLLAQDQAPQKDRAAQILDETLPGQPMDAPSRYDNPYTAYQNGAYEQALSAFEDRRVEAPEEPWLHMNVGATQFKMGDYAAAERSFLQALAGADDAVRSQAFYNLGNVAYRQGRLEEAVELYQRTLDVDPDDEDAKYNLEFVRDEIRRRIEEAQKRQQEQQQEQQEGEQESQQGGGQQQEEQQGGQQDEEQQDGQPESQPQGGERQQEQEQEQQSGGQQDEPQQSGGSEPEASPSGDDRDGDALPDSTEATGENPTDPRNPDSDGDGLRDGEEDANQNGRVDPGETDPNRADSDGDGIRDGEETEAGGAAGAAGQPGDPQQMTPEEAQRLLQSLEEGRPVRAHPAQGRARRPAKDW